MSTDDTTFTPDDVAAVFTGSEWVTEEPQDRIPSEADAVAAAAADADPFDPHPDLPPVPAKSPEEQQADQEIVDAAPVIELVPRIEEADDDEVDDDLPPEKQNQSERLIRMARSKYRLGFSDEGEPFAVRKGGPNIAHILRRTSGSLRAELAAEYFDELGKAASSAALATAMNTLDGFARRQERTTLHVRVARDPDGGIWIDRGDATGEAIHITPAGWTFARRSPVVFRRSELTGALPRPTAGGSATLLGDIINVNDEYLQLIIGWLVGSVIPDIKHPPLAILGIQGSGKSAAQSCIVCIIDPGPAPLRTAPRDAQDWIVAANGSWFVGLDNLSSIRFWLSDAICRAATGDGLVTRALYTDADLKVTSFRRVVLFNGIELGAIRGDLADRTLFLELEPIHPQNRRTDSELDALFKRHHAGILGGILDLVVAVLARLPNIKLETKPRMADFAEVLAAVDEETGWETLRMFEAVQADQQREVLEADAVAVAVAGLMDEADGHWMGTATELLERLTPEKPPRRWPSTPQSLSGRLKRAVPSLTATGILVHWDRGTDRRRRRLIEIAKVGK